MQNGFLLGVSVGEAFAEYCLMQGSTTVATKRAYTSRESLKNSLQQFVANHTDKKISKAAVSLRVSEKLMDFKLHGAVAHVTTLGFENWLNLNEGSLLSLTSSNLQFGLRERLQADGSVSIDLTTDELESLAEKLKQAEVKKVCLHLLHASRNPVHEVKAAEFLREKNFEVFVPEKTDNADEVSRWNKNALNAIIGNLFLDLKKNIEAALQDVIPSENIYYLTAQGEFTQDLSQSVSCLAAGTTAMAMNLREKSDVLYLGLENFVLISGQCWNIHWQSSWGSLENKQISFRELAIQPTQEISLNAFQHFDFGKDSEGWEPGPMFLGRGHKGMLLDLWAEDARLSQVDGFGDRQSPVGVQRFKNSLRALAKVSHSQEKEPANIISELQHLAQHKVALEALLFRQHEKILVTGPLANLFEPSFKKDAGKISIKVDDFAMSRSLALLGQSLLKG